MISHAMEQQTLKQAARSWTTRRDEKRRRMQLVQPWMEGSILPKGKIIEALETLLVSGDRIVLEGDNQKQADFLSRSLVKVVDNKDVKSLVTFLMTFALPCSLFVTIARTPHESLWGQAKPAVVLAIVYVAVFVATYYASRNLGKETTVNSAVLALTLGFPNHAGVGIPLLLAVYGAKASVTVAVGLAVGAITITPITLAILESGSSAGKTLSPAVRIRISLWRAVQKPVFWAPVLGVLASVVNFHMPIHLDKSLAILGDATEGTALFVTGLIVSAQRFNLNWSVGWAVLGKNVIQPALCLAIALLLGMSLEQTRFVVLLSAIPSGFFGILFGKGFDAAPEVARSSLVASTVLSIFTLAGWIILLSHLH